ncbi:hypothetical protein MHU86_3442 [Fragilaria crotonensis]|nr:hypothetical protein MHU86_3442 [Fragilaria crotonensis]
MTGEKTTRQDYRNRIREICQFLRKNYINYCDAGGVRDLTIEEQANSEFFHHRNTVDLKYEGMNTKLILAFLAMKKTKANGKTTSHGHIRKYHDAILYGAEKVKERLPTEYYEEIDKFLHALKKECAKAKAEGNLDEREADPISWGLFRIILEWALSENNVFAWVFTLLQWNCMARSINIGVLGFHNFRLGEDNIICRYDKHKSDQTGETAHDKHLFANPFDGLVNLYLGLGVWFSIETARFANSEDIFKREDTDDGAASHRYCAQMMELFSKFKGLLGNYIRPGHASTHSFRKGSGTYSQSGTTCPPSVSSTANRGEWSLGHVLDLYWHIAEPGDCYLGRILAGLDPNDASFGAFPPHFIMTDPMRNPDVQEVMQLMYGPILRQWSGHEVDPTGLLLRCLASVVWHSDFLKKWARNVPGHSFATIPLLNNASLLQGLKGLVTIQPTESMKVSSGIPPHVNNAILIKKILDLCIGTLEEVKKLTESVKAAVSDAYEAKAMENGQITLEQMKTIFSAYELEIKSYVKDQITLLRQEIPLQTHQEQAPAEGTVDDFGVPFADGELDEPQAHSSFCFRNFAHGGRFWCVPEAFQLPSRIKLENGWRIWLQGLPGFQIEDRDHIARAAPIRPFRKFTNALLPAEVKKRFFLHWSPIFKAMEETPGLVIPDNPLDIDGNFLANSFSRAMEYLRERRLQYVFLNKRAKPNDWEVATWSKHVRRSMINKYGTEEDKANLPEANRFNGRRVQHSKRKRAPPVLEGNQRRVKRRRERRTQAKQSANDTLDDDMNAIEIAEFGGDIEMTARMQALDERIQEEVREEAENDAGDKRAERNRVGDAVGTDGTLLFVGGVQEERAGVHDQLLRNDGGHLSLIERQQYARLIIDHDTSTICAAGNRCQMHGAPAPSTHRCPSCDRHIHAICGILMDNAPNEFHNRKCFDCQDKSN